MDKDLELYQALKASYEMITDFNEGIIKELSTKNNHLHWIIKCYKIYSIIITVILVLLLSGRI